jgi:hypothetical protein
MNHFTIVFSAMAVLNFSNSHFRFAIVHVDGEGVPISF